MRSRTGSLPPHHRDPFDRMLIAQAQAEGLVLVTRDPDIPRYGVEHPGRVNHAAADTDHVDYRKR